MKKTYEAPSVEKIAFQYRDQVVVASGDNQWVNRGPNGCESEDQISENTQYGTCYEN